MARKSKDNQKSSGLSTKKEKFVPTEPNEKFFSDSNNFIDDTTRYWVANTKSKLDKDGLSVKQHLLIYHVAIIAGWFRDDLYPTLKDKCIQYHHERNLASIGVTAESFYKSYSSVEFSYLKVPIETELDKEEKSENSKEKEEPEFKLIKKKYIDLELIDSIVPFILQWYPTASFFLQTLNVAPYSLDESDYYWIFRKIKVHYPQEFKYFFEKNCSHLNFNTFKSIYRRKNGSKIPGDLNSRVDDYIKEHYPKAINEFDV